MLDRHVLLLKMGDMTNENYVWLEAEIVVACQGVALRKNISNITLNSLLDHII